MKKHPTINPADPASRIYYDPADEPAAGAAVLMTWYADRRRKWRANSVEECLRAFQRFAEDDGEDWIFRRVGDEYFASLQIWEIPEPIRRGKEIAGASGRLLGRYHIASSFRRTVQIDPELGKRYGVQEVYLLSDEIAENFSYLDRTGKIRPLNISVDGDAIEHDSDEVLLREEVEEAILLALEPVYPYSRRP